MNLLRNVRNPKVKCNLLNKSADEKFSFFVTRNYLLLIMKIELTEGNTKASNSTPFVRPGILQVLKTFVIHLECMKLLISIK